jgi:hypothetical protein
MSNRKISLAIFAVYLTGLVIGILIGGVFL